MGTIQHNAMVVTGSAVRIEEAHTKAASLGLTVSPLSDVVVNGTQSFAVFPDGSKEGWAESDEGDRARMLFRSWLKLQTYEDGSSWFKWVEVEYGERGIAVVDGHDGSKGLHR